MQVIGYMGEAPPQDRGKARSLHAGRSEARLAWADSDNRSMRKG